MAQYLWGVAQLVNDPSSDLINIVRQSFVSNNAKPNPTDESQGNKELPKVAESKEVNHRVTFLSGCVPQTSCARNDKNKQFSSKYVQVGQPICKCHEASVQSHKSWSIHVSKTTSTHVTRLSRSTNTYEPTPKKDACTESMKQRICQNHRDVFNILKDWPRINLDRNNNGKKFTVRLKNSISKIINYFKIDKIQNFPEYHGPETNHLLLYKEVSCVKLE
ncbi:unnamed protein product, partial [Brenthis ino]